MTQLLVSVRSAQEAEAAVRGGAALIDVKEPSRGSLGRAGDDALADVVRTVAGRRPVSAALGELLDAPGSPGPPQDRSLAFVKWGLAGYTTHSANDWREALRLALRGITKSQPSCRGVAVAYADWRRAGAPAPEDVCAFAVENTTGAFLIDTWHKDGSTLLDWLSLAEIECLEGRCRTTGVPMALAGSLGVEQIRQLLPLRPDWIAVRGAVCQGRRREATIDEEKVRQLATMLGQEHSAGKLIPNTDPDERPTP